MVYHTINFPPGLAPPRFLPPKASADALYASPEMLQKEISSKYSGKVVVGKDLDVVLTISSNDPYRVPNGYRIMRKIQAHE